MLFHHEKGQGLPEYALLFALLALVVIVILTLMGDTLANFFANLI
jgi:Flp pilus assembly pilin Flp